MIQIDRQISNSVVGEVSSKPPMVADHAFSTEGVCCGSARLFVSLIFGEADLMLRAKLRKNGYIPVHNGMHFTEFTLMLK